MKYEIMIPTGLITIGDCPSDLAFSMTAGPVLRRAVAEAGWLTIAEAIVPDDAEQIARTVRDFAQLGCHLILTSGGTGQPVGDFTPEAFRTAAWVEIPGEEALMESGPEDPSPALAPWLGPGVVVDDSFMVVLPGEPAAAVAGFGLAAGMIPPVVARLRDGVK